MGRICSWAWFSCLVHKWNGDQLVPSNRIFGPDPERGETSKLSGRRGTICPSSHSRGKPSRSRPSLFSHPSGRRLLCRLSLGPAPSLPPSSYWRWRPTTDLTRAGCAGGTATPSSLRASLRFPTAGESLLAGRWQRTAPTLLPGARRRCCLQIRTGRNHFPFF